jgi:hypothetical protein
MGELGDGGGGTLDEFTNTNANVLWGQGQGTKLAYEAPALRADSQRSGLLLTLCCSLSQELAWESSFSAIVLSKRICL